MDARIANCPTDADLRSYGLGKLDDTASGSVTDHLEICLACRRRVSELSGDSFLGRMKAAHRKDSTPAPPRSLDPGTIPQPSGHSPPDPAAAGVPPELANHPQYAELKELGRGGMGVVYTARNTLMDRPEVLKVVGRALLDRPGAVGRFLREMQSAARLQHRNVVAAYSGMQLGDLLVFAMEFVPGENLADVVTARGPLPVVNACYYAYQVAQGLQHAHEKGMVHRDIKPGNLMLTRDGKKQVVKILDFGLAKATREKAGGETGLTGEGQMLGTPDYMAPEQVRDAASADIRADVYSLGCTLYYLLAGKPPFAGHVLYVLVQHESAAAEPLDAIRPDVPADLAAVVARMMAKNAADRFQTPGEAAAALAPFFKLGTKPGDSQTRPAAQSATAVAVPAARPLASDSVWQSLADTDPTPEPKAAPRSRRKWLGPAAAVGLALAGLFAVVAGVVLLRTENGVIQIEDLPTDATVELDGRVITVSRNGQTMRIEEVARGKHTLRVLVAGVEMFTEDVTVNLGGKPVPVKYKPKESTAQREHVAPKTDAEAKKEESSPPPPAGMVADLGGLVVGGSFWEGRKRNMPNRVVPNGTDEPFELRVSERNGDKFKGTILVDAKRTYVVEGTVDGDRLSFTTELKGGFQQTYTGKLRGQTIEFTFEGTGPGGVGVKGTATLTPRKHAERKDGISSGKEGKSELDDGNRDPSGKERDPLAKVAADGFVPLFNGKDTKGWREASRQQGAWRVKEGILIGQGWHSILLSPRTDYTDVHIKARVKINDRGDGSLFVRSAPTGSAVLHGYEGRISMNGQDVSMTGRLNIANKPVTPIPKIASLVGPDVWFDLDVIAQGNRIRVLVNGIETADYTDVDKQYSRGAIALRVRDTKSVIEFQSVEVKELR